MFNTLFPDLGPLPGIQQTGSGLAPLLTTAAPAKMPMNVGQSPPFAPVPLMERLKRGIAGLPSMLLPDQSNGFLTSKEQSAARNSGLLDFGLSLLAGANGTNGGNAPSFGQALLGAVGHARDTYNAASDRAVNQKLQGMQLSATQHMLTGRQAIGKFMQDHMTGDPEKDGAVIQQAWMLANALGDTDLAKSLEAGATKAMEHPNPIQVAAGGDTMLLDPRDLHPLARVHHTPSPVDPSVLEERQMRLQMAMAEAQARGDTRAAMQLQQQANRENMIVDNYRNDPDVKYGTAVAQVAGQLEALKARALAGDPFAQYQALEGALRLRNPEMNRAPNPQDYAVLAESMGFTGKLKKMVEHFQMGTILPADAMRKLYITSENMVRQGKTRMDEARKNHVARASAYGVPEAAIPDPFASVKLPPEDAQQGFNPLMPLRGVLTPQDR